jgi:hypothetical protein
MYFIVVRSFVEKKEVFDVLHGSDVRIDPQLPFFGYEPLFLPTIWLCSLVIDIKNGLSDLSEKIRTFSIDLTRLMGTSVSGQEIDVCLLWICSPRPY